VISVRKNDTVLIAGASGFIGSAIAESMNSEYRVISANHEGFELEKYDETYRMIEKYEPRILINATGKVAGIQGNLDNPTELLAINARIALNISKAAHELNVLHVIQFASACIYPLNEITPSKPTDIGKGAIEESSKSYAMSKLLAIELFSAYRKQFGRQWITVIPSNLYGIGDWSHGSQGHVASMLMERFSKATNDNVNEVEVWGDGQSLRNFLNVRDLASAVKFIIDNKIWSEEVVNVCGEPEISINDLTKLMAEVIHFKGKILFDKSKPNGARRKILDDSYIRSFGWSPSISLSDGFSDYYESYLRNL
jgi:GDP-L-fucose synthase